jgi:hypothetical protein
VEQDKIHPLYIKYILIVHNVFFFISAHPTVTQLRLSVLHIINLNEVGVFSFISHRQHSLPVLSNLSNQFERNTVFF